MPQKSRSCAGPSCRAKIYTDNKTGLCRACLDRHQASPPPAAAPPRITVSEDRAKQKQAATLADLKARYDEALRTIAEQERVIAVNKSLASGVDTFTIEPRHGSGTSEGTIVVLASDWHVEEKVGPEVGGLNRYSLEIAKARATRFFQSVVRLTRLLQQDIRIEHAVVGLLGDYITNDIHDAENAESNEVPPNTALLFAQNLLISGIQFLLDHTQLRLTFMCHSGNHARTTKTTRFTTENAHSLEYLMFHFLANHFRGEPRVTFVIPDGMHSYLTVYGTTLRFQHGHAMKYGGGVGGIYIPINKAIAQWNKGKRADLDCFGHFHQLRDGGNFICNGSLIGYNAFALSIKADYEQPKQALFLIDKKRGRTCTWPVLVE